MRVWVLGLIVLVGWLGSTRPAAASCDESDNDYSRTAVKFVIGANVHEFSLADVPETTLMANNTAIDVSEVLALMREALDPLPSGVADSLSQIIVINHPLALQSAAAPSDEAFVDLIAETAAQADLKENTFGIAIGGGTFPGCPS